jgi:hypothetical protein
MCMQVFSSVFSMECASNNQSRLQTTNFTSRPHSHLYHITQMYNPQYDWLAVPFACSLVLTTRVIPTDGLMFGFFYWIILHTTLYINLKKNTSQGLN